MVSLETEADRTLFFDLLPLEVGRSAGSGCGSSSTRSRARSSTTRRAGWSSRAWTASCSWPTASCPRPSRTWRRSPNLRQNLEELGLDPKSVPLVFQYNKRDLRNILPVDKLQQSLNPGGAPVFEAAAVHGVGVFETLKEISRLSLDAIRAEDRRAEEVRRRGRRTPASRAAAARGATPAAPAVAPSPPRRGQAGRRHSHRAGTDPALMEPLQVEFAEEDTTS